MPSQLAEIKAVEKGSGIFICKVYFSFFLSALFLIGCLNTSKTDLNIIHISGQIINPVLDNIKFESINILEDPRVFKD